MSQHKVKFYKNPARNESVEHKSYIPQYQILGVEPIEIKPNMVSADTKVAQNSPDNPRIKNIGLQKSFDTSDVPKGQINLPQVGYSRDHTWSGVDGEIVDDLEIIDSDVRMIDNNDFVSEQAFSQPATQVEKPVSKATPSTSDEDILSALNKLEDKNYLLLVDGVVICSGNLEYVQEQTKLLAFGEHPICDGNPIHVSELLVIKKIPIKVGLFLE